jgi:uncharacterized protein (DUF433 family)
MNETELLERITVNPQIFGGKPIIRGRRLAVEHVLGTAVIPTQVSSGWSESQRGNKVPSATPSFNNMGRC